MNKSLTFVTLAVCALLAFPVGSAEWMSYGSSEPDTVLDSATFMWPDAPGASKTRIYFNAFATSGGSRVNPNVAALGSSIESAGTEEMYAILGVWTDCNGDGYVGLAETAAREYRSELLTNTALCPSGGGSSNPGTPNNAWNGANNYAGWVVEFIPIGDDGATAGDRRIFKDVEAAVWGDYGRYTDASTDSGGGTCAVTPLPRGTLQSTGGTLTYVDCNTGILGAWNTVVDAAEDPLGLRFEDDTDGTSGPLGQQETLGESDSDQTIVKANDCSAPVLVPVTPPDGEPGQGIRGPSTSVNPDGSVAATVNYTVESMPLPTRETNSDVGPESTSNCDFEDDRGDEAYILEGDFNSVPVQGKAEADWNFGFQTMTRGGVPVGGLTGSAGAPNDAGITAGSGNAGEGPSMWFGGSTLLAKTPGVVATRGNVQDPASLGADPADGYWLAYYAYVGPQTTGRGFELPGGGQTAKYGQSQCGAFTSGIHNGWECDASKWNLNADGTPVPDPQSALARPGKVYNLRDQDCYDGRIDAVGLGVQPAFYGAGSCIEG